MSPSPTDEKRRKFLKHLGILGVGALIGMGLGAFSYTPDQNITNEYSAVEISSGRKIVWATTEEYENSVTPTGESFKEKGLPKINTTACAYHVSENMVDDSKGIVYSDSLKSKFCTMPCKDICPVDAISIYEAQNEKSVPLVDEDKCIGCGKCFKICGYNAIQWINEP
jgi:NAD-dependent dihydropyrimidine dehydrogenase PreA subunit